MSVSYSTKLLLAFRSGDRCAFPECGRALSVDGDQSNPIVTGEAAHIAGEKAGSARFNGTMSEEQRSHYNNLLYLCGDHHTQIDKQVEEFPVDRLRRMKSEHEARVRGAMTEAFGRVGFPELEEATNWIRHLPPDKSTPDFTVIPPEVKLKKNNLGDGPRVVVTMGLSLAREVREYVEGVARTDSDFPERLRVGFLNEYYRLRREGNKGDELFDLMCGFSQRGLKDQASRCAGLAVLVYLFEACEVFER